MKVPSRLNEKVLSALQIAKLTGEIKTGLFEVMRSLEFGKAKYLIIPLDARPKNNKIRKKFATLHLLAKDKKIFCFDISDQKTLGKIVGLDMGVSCVSILNPDRAESLFKSVMQEMQQEVRI